MGKLSKTTAEIEETLRAADRYVANEFNIINDHRRLDSLETTVAAMPGRIEAAVAEEAARLDAFKATKGAAGGLAQLDGSGKLPIEIFAEIVSSVRPIDTVVESSGICERPIESGRTYRVVWHNTYHRIMAQPVTDIPGWVEACFTDFPMAKYYGSPTDTGILPSRWALYVITDRTGLWYFDKVRLIDLTGQHTL